MRNAGARKNGTSTMDLLSRNSGNERGKRGSAKRQGPLFFDSPDILDLAFVRRDYERHVRAPRKCDSLDPPRTQAFAA
jgi:hypothetical protein